MRRYFVCCIVVAVNLTVLAAARADDDAKWELEERRGFIFTLSYKQSTYIKDQQATSELAFLCDQRNVRGVVGAILIPFDGTFESHQGSIPVSIQRNPVMLTDPTFFRSGRMEASFFFWMRRMMSLILSRC